MQATRSEPTGVRLALVFVAAFLAVGLAYASVFVVPPLITVFTDDLGLSHAQAGLLMSAYLAAYAVASYVSGSLAERFGVARVMTAGTLACGLAGLLFAATESYAVFLVSRAALGAGLALVYAPGIALIAQIAPPRRTLTLVSVYLAGVSAGITVAFLATPLLEDALSWRWPFVVVAIATLTGGVLFALLTRGLDGPAGSRAPAPGGLAALWRNPAFVRICAGLFAGMFVLYGVYTWIPPYLDETAGFSAGRISLALTIANIVGIPVTVAAGWLADRFDRPVLVAGVGVGTAVAVFALAATDTISYAVATLVAIATFAGTTAGMAAFFAVSPRTVDRSLAARATGLAVSVAMSGAIVSTYAGGALVEATGGYDVPFLVYGVATLVTVGLLYPLAARSLARMGDRDLV